MMKRKWWDVHIMGIHTDQVVGKIYFQAVHQLFFWFAVPR